MISFVRGCLLLVALGLTVSAHPTNRTNPASHPSQTSDEQVVRALTEQYCSAISVGDLEAMRRLWDQKSPQMAARLRTYQELFSTYRMEVLRKRVSFLEVKGETAASRLTIDERRFDKKTGALITVRGVNNGACRSFEWIKTEAGWKVEREWLVQEELAAKLEAASEAERNQILQREKEFVKIGRAHV